MKKAKEKCGLEMPILIYFYSNQNCSNCLKQGYEITNLRTELYNENEMLRVYTYDGSMNDSIVVKTSRKEFNITTYPTMVLMKNNVSIIEGLHTKDQMKQELTILN